MEPMRDPASASGLATARPVSPQARFPALPRFPTRELPRFPALPASPFPQPRFPDDETTNTL